MWGGIIRAFNFGANFCELNFLKTTSCTEIPAGGWLYDHGRYNFVPLRLGEAGFGYFLFKEKVTDAPTVKHAASHYLNRRFFLLVQS